MFLLDYGPYTLPDANGLMPQYTCPWPSCVPMVSDERPSLQCDLFSSRELATYPSSLPAYSDALAQ
jgi:hypothetical protein